MTILQFCQISVMAVPWQIAVMDFLTIAMSNFWRMAAPQYFMVDMAAINGRILAFCHGLPSAIDNTVIIIYGNNDRYRHSLFQMLVVRFFISFCFLKVELSLVACSWYQCSNFRIKFNFGFRIRKHKHKLSNNFDRDC